MILSPLPKVPRNMSPGEQKVTELGSHFTTSNCLQNVLFSANWTLASLLELSCLRCKAFSCLQARCFLNTDQNLITSTPLVDGYCSANAAFLLFLPCPFPEDKAQWKVRPDVDLLSKLLWVSLQVYGLELNIPWNQECNCKGASLLNFIMASFASKGFWQAWTGHLTYREVS